MLERNIELLTDIEFYRDSKVTFPVEAEVVFELVWESDAVQTEFCYSMT